MLPHFDVNIEISLIDPGMLRVGWLDEVSSDGIGDNRVYEDLGGSEWSDVEAVIAAEDSLIRQVVGPLSPFLALDVGVMAAVAALSASGCVSTTSCRGHHARGAIETRVAIERPPEYAGDFVTDVRRRDLSWAPEAT